MGIIAFVICVLAIVFLVRENIALSKKYSEFVKQHIALQYQLNKQTFNSHQQSMTKANEENKAWAKDVAFRESLAEKISLKDK